ncbi:hypothetical protein P8452_77833 [Trifolium repens]|nr:hypothetical protein P8452_77833 [Trifolium repens]
MSSDLETTSNKAISSAHKKGISISKRDLPPADYLFKIKPYPSSIDKQGENNNYLTIQDGDGVVRKFSEMKDSCVFGAEVFVIRHCDNWESLYIVNDPPQISLTWKIEQISYLRDWIFKSFTVGERDWTFSVNAYG